MKTPILPIMSIPFENKRFRINPIEIAVFAVVGLIFVKSGYNLLYGKGSSETTALTATAQDPIRVLDRDPAQVQANQSTFSEVKIGCDPSVVTPATNSAKIRLIGSLCTAATQVQNSKAPKAVPNTEEEVSNSDESSANQNTTSAIPATTEEAAENVKSVSVINTSARVAATVFPDYSNQRFSTDYISLTQGKNLIYVQYVFKDGKTLGQEFSVTKN